MWEIEGADFVTLIPLINFYFSNSLISAGRPSMQMRNRHDDKRFWDDRTCMRNLINNARNSSWITEQYVYWTPFCSTLPAENFILLGRKLWICPKFKAIQQSYPFILRLMQCITLKAIITLSEINLPGMKALCVSEIMWSIINFNMFAKTLKITL